MCRDGLGDEKRCFARGCFEILSVEKNCGEMENHSSFQELSIEIMFFVDWGCAERGRAIYL